MDSTSLSPLLGVKPPWYIKEISVQPKNKVVDVYLDFEKGSKFPCPHCGQVSPVYDSSYKRVRYLDLFDYRCYLNIKSPRLNCSRDGVKSASVDPWTRKGSHYSIKFESLIMQLCKEMSMFAVSQHLGEPDTNLWRVFKALVERMVLDTLDLKDVRRVCVDETAVRRGHKYVTIFTDYDTGQVIYVAQGRKKEVFDEFFGWLWDMGGLPQHIELFSMDMSRSYIAGQQAYFASSEIVFDRFHIKKGLNEAVDKVRKQEVKENESLKKTKYIWLKNEQNLSSAQKLQLQNFLADSSIDTAKAYGLKAEFDQLWLVQPNAVKATLDAWVNRARALELKPIDTFVNTVLRNSFGIINSIVTGVTNAVSEGINSVVQLARTRARGFRNIENFSYMIYYVGNQ